MEGLTEIIVDKNLTIFILHILNTSKPLLLNYSKTRIQTTKDSGCFARFCFSKASVTNEGCLRGKHLFSNSNKPGGGIQGREGCPGNGLCGCRISYLCGQQREFTSEKSTKTQPRLVASQLNSQYRYLVMRVENHIKKPETFEKFPASTLQGTEGGTRTRTGLLPHAPETCARLVGAGGAVALHQAVEQLAVLAVDHGQFQVAAPDDRVRVGEHNLQSGFGSEKQLCR